MLSYNSSTQVVSSSPFVDGNIKDNSSFILPKPKVVPNTLVYAFECIQGGLTFAGAIGNLLVIITLIRRRYQSQFAGAMFIHQTVMDFFVCIISLIIILTRGRILMIGIPFIDAAICHAWESQLIYWYFVFLSVQNLIMIGMDRYIAVFRPLSYKSLRYRDAAIFLVILHLYSILVNVADVFIVRYDAVNVTCLSEHLFATSASVTFFKAYGIIWFCLVYLIPVISLLLIYGIIVLRLTAHKDSKASRHRQRAASELTKTAVVITVIFIVCFSYDCIYYLLGNIQVVKYEFNTPIQTLGVVLVALNSCVNPLVYCLMMKSFRGRMYSAICCCCWKCMSTPDQNSWATVGDAKSKSRKKLHVTLSAIRQAGESMLGHNSQDSNGRFQNSSNVEASMRSKSRSTRLAHQTDACDGSPVHLIENVPDSSQTDSSPSTSV